VERRTGGRSKAIEDHGEVATLHVHEGHDETFVVLV
jgi:hypothetical protein